ncbi:MAG: polymer-forming cytoskeletal protein [Cyanothece sp. SIO1E1]|nr:polymer-forming cytoskeletal protein [Cyanothece sp. SIO1E1]
MKFTKRSRILIKQGILFLAALVLLPILFTLSPAGSVDIQTGSEVSIAAEEVIPHSVYLAGQDVAIDGTVQGNVMAAGSQITVNGTIADDMYLAGETITIDGVVQGDAIVAGRMIKINGTIEGDLMTAGQAVILNSVVGDDARIAGEILVLDPQTQIGDDLIAAGASLESKANSQVGGNLYFSGSQAMLAGTVDQNVIGDMNALTLSGTVAEEVNVTIDGGKSLWPLLRPKQPIEVPKLSAGLTLTDTAQMGGPLTYKSDAEAQISQTAQVTGAVIREELQPWQPPASTPAEVVLNRLRRLVTLGLVGGLIVWLCPDWTDNLAESIQSKPLSSFGWGIVTLIAVAFTGLAIAAITSFLVVLLIATLPGLILPVLGIGILAYLTLLVSFGIFTAFVPQITLSLLGGRWLLHKPRPSLASDRFMALLVGLIIYTILTAIPVLSGIISLIIFFLGLGALWLWSKARFFPSSNQPMATA